MVLLLDIVRDNLFKFSSQYSIICENLLHAIFRQTGIHVKLSRYCQISKIASCIIRKFKKKKFSKEKFIHSEESWLGSIDIQVRK